MKTRYDFKGGKRGRILPERPLEPGKVKLSIRLDGDILDYFNAQADKTGGKIGYQTLINAALREHIEGKSPKFEEALRRILREELRKTG